jgi:hypothetical protein
MSSLDEEMQEARPLLFQVKRTIDNDDTRKNGKTSQEPRPVDQLLLGWINCLFSGVCIRPLPLMPGGFLLLTGREEAGEAQGTTRPAIVDREHYLDNEGTSPGDLDRIKQNVNAP